MTDRQKTVAGVSFPPTPGPGGGGGEGSSVRSTTGGLAGSAAAVIGSGPFTDDGRAPDDLNQSGIWRTGIHESGHICTSRFLNLEVAGSTLVEGPGYSGLTWSSGSKRALRGKAAYDADSAAHDAVAVRVADGIAQRMPLPGEARDGAADIFAAVQAEVIVLMGGGAAEMAVLGDAPPQFIASDMLSANAIAGIVCRTPASRAAFIEHCYQEAVAIIDRNKPVVLALARALIDHPERTLNAVEIDQVIGAALAAEAAAAERQRRLDWKRIEQSAASFADLTRERFRVSGVKRTWPNWAGMSQFDPSETLRTC
jgi:hypothetical protein